MSEVQAARADIHADRVRIAWDEGQTAIAPERIPAFLATNTAVRLLPPATLEWKLDTARAVPLRLDEVRHALAALITPPAELPGASA